MRQTLVPVTVGSWLAEGTYSLTRVLEPGKNLLSPSRDNTSQLFVAIYQ